MRYLVTGASGLLGNNVIRQLVERGDEVRVIVRKASNKRAFEHVSVELVDGDVTDAASMQRACLGADVVIHSAGDVYLGWRHQEQSYRVNVEGTRNVARAARECGARLVHVSTINALGLGQLSSPATEETALPGIVPAPYVLSKREADKVVREEIERGLWATIVHPSLMFGPFDWKPSSGKMIVGVSKFSVWAPTGAINVVDARDAARGTILAAERGTCGRDYIIGGENVTYKELWSRIAILAGKRPPWIPMGLFFYWIIGCGGDMIASVTRHETTANSAMIGLSRQEHCFVSTRAQEELGFTARSLNETLSDTWKWFIEQGHVKPASSDAHVISSH